MVDDPQELILEHLRHIRAKVDANDTGLRDVKQMITGLREEVNAGISYSSMSSASMRLGPIRLYLLILRLHVHRSP